MIIREIIHFIDKRKGVQTFLWISLFVISFGLICYWGMYYSDKDKLKEEEMSLIASECRSLAMNKDFVAAHEKLNILASDAEDNSSDFSYVTEIKKKRYEDTFDYVFNAEAMHLCAIGDKSSLDRLIFLLSSIPIKGAPISEGTEYKIPWLDFDSSRKEAHEQYIDYANSFNLKCDVLVDLGIAHHNYSIISRVLPLYKRVPDFLSKKEGRDGEAVSQKLSYSDSSKFSAIKKINKAIKDEVFPGISTTIK